MADITPIRQKLANAGNYTAMALSALERGDTVSATRYLAVVNADVSDAHILAIRDDRNR